MLHGSQWLEDKLLSIVIQGPKEESTDYDEMIESEVNEQTYVKTSL